MKFRNWDNLCQFNQCMSDKLHDNLHIVKSYPHSIDFNIHIVHLTFL